MKDKNEDPSKEKKNSNSTENLKSKSLDSQTNLKKKESKNLGSYILEHDLGEGTFGKVKRARNIQTDEKVAIKILDKTKIIEDSDDIKRLEREICILKKIRHKNIIQLYEIMESRKNLYLVMEYAEGKELFDYIVSKKRLPEMEACKLYQEIIDGIEYLHIQNIVHRDLKPENLLLDHKKSIKISDFGLSTIYSNDKLLKTPCGTPSYAPPEMLKGQKYHGLLSDIWSSGVILFAMICGYLPFSESKDELVIRKIVQGNFEIPNHVSPLLKDFIKNVLKPDPLERYDLEQIKEHPWFNILKPKFCPGIIVGFHNIPIDEKILKQLEDYGYDKEKARTQIQNNKFDTMTAIYNLCLRKFIKEGGKSISDMFSSKFKTYMMSPESLLSNNKPTSDKDLKERQQKENKDLENKDGDVSRFKRKKNSSDNKEKESKQNNKKLDEIKVEDNEEAPSDEREDQKAPPKPCITEDTKKNSEKRNKSTKDRDPETTKNESESNNSNTAETKVSKNKNEDMPQSSKPKHERKISVNSNLDKNFFKIITNKESNVNLENKDKSNIDKLDNTEKPTYITSNKTTIEEANTSQVQTRKDISPKVNISTIQKVDRQAKNSNLPLKTEVCSSTKPKNESSHYNANLATKLEERTKRNAKSPPVKILSTEAQAQSKISAEKSKRSENLSTKQDTTKVSVISTEVMIKNCRKQNEEIAKLLKDAVNPVLKLKNMNYNNYNLPRQIESEKVKVINPEVGKNFLKINPDSIIKNNQNLNVALKNIYSHQRSNSYQTEAIKNNLEMCIRPKNSRKRSEMDGTNNISGIIGMLDKNLKNDNNNSNYKAMNTDTSMTYNRVVSGNANKNNHNTSRVNHTEVFSTKNHEREYRKIQPKSSYSNRGNFKKKLLNISTQIENDLDRKNDNDITGEFSVSHNKTKKPDRNLSFSPKNAIKAAKNNSYLQEKSKLIAEKLKKQKKLTPNRFIKTSMKAVNSSFTNNLKLITNEKFKNNIPSVRTKDSLDTKGTIDTKGTNDILSDDEVHTPDNISNNFKNPESVETKHRKSNSNMSDTFSNRLNHNASTEKQKYQKRGLMNGSKEKKNKYNAAIRNNKNVISFRDNSVNNQISFSDYGNDYNFPLKKVAKTNNNKAIHFNEKSDKSKVCNNITDLNISRQYHPNNSIYTTTNINTTIIINNPNVIPIKDEARLDMHGINPKMANRDLDSATNSKVVNANNMLYKPHQQNVNILKTEVNTTRNNHSNNKVIKIGDKFVEAMQDLSTTNINNLNNVNNGKNTTKFSSQPLKTQNGPYPQQKTNRSEAMKNNYLFKSKHEGAYLLNITNVNINNTNNNEKSKASSINEKIKQNLSNLNLNNIDEFVKTTTTPVNKGETDNENTNIKVYSGPLDFNCLISLKNSNNNIQSFVEKTISFLKKKKLSVVQVGTYRIKVICNQNTLNFDIELFKIEDLDGFEYYVKFRKYQGEYSEFRKVCNLILAAIK